MTRLRMVPALLLFAVLGGCDTGLLDITPEDEIAEVEAIVDRASAESALMGAYSALQDADLYGTDYLVWTDLLTDDVEHTGTFGSYGQADLINVTADNGVVFGIWAESYDGINRVNNVLEKVPGLDNIDPADADLILGQAYGLRALNFFNLVRAYGGVPLVLDAPNELPDIDETARMTRASLAETYAQIESDLAQARTLLAGTGNDDRTFVTPGFIDALQAKVHLYQEEWQEAEDAAMAVVNSTDYDLVASYGALFDADGAPTVEDLFRVLFIPTDPNNYGYYYQFEGRFEVGATEDLYNAYDADNDQRFAYQFDEIRSDGIEVVKYPTTTGTEDIHVIRYAELLLILAEAHAQQNELGPAVTYLEMVRDRAGLAPYAAGAVNTQQEVLDAIFLERRLELAFEGERWFDLVRSGRAAAALGGAFAPHEALLPIPQSELDVAPNLEQNPGY